MENSLSDIIYTIDLDECTRIVQQAYRDHFNGDWDKNTEFRFHNNTVALFAPSYTPYMLYGRGPGKMPPQQPIENWMARKGIMGSSWAIRSKIAKEGTKGTDFLTPAMNQVLASITKTLSETIASAVAGMMSRQD